MKKRLTKILAIVMAVVMTFSITGCKNKSAGGSDDPNCLDVYLLYKGYGDAWLREVAKLFEKESWVEEKYPGFKVNITTDGEDAHARRKLDNPATNKFDIMFGVNIKPFETTGKIVDITDSVYLSKVPGENVNVIDKIPERILGHMSRKDAAAPNRADGNDSYYAVNYIDGTMGILYNHTILCDENGWEIPLTTDHFMEIGADIESKGYNTNSLGKKNTVIINFADNAYWTTAYTVWWAQYVGEQGYNDFFEGYNASTETDKDISVLDQKGRLEALTTMSDILSSFANKVTDLSNHETTQTAFLMGNGLFHYNGDYFTTEMATEIKNLESRKANYDIRYMKMPIISKIIENLPDSSIADDIELREVIKKIDLNLSYEESGLTDSVTKNDYLKIAEARGISLYSAASGQVAVIPTISPAKDIAADFLRFMYTEKAIKAFSSSTRGIIFPTNYDFYADSETYSKFDNISKSKLEITNGTEVCPFVRLQLSTNTKLGSVGLEPIYFKGKFENVFISSGTAKMTPAQILAAEKEHWLLNWDVMISQAK